jgi:NitT/TauT family transport system substrate-binding protein
MNQSNRRNLFLTGFLMQLSLFMILPSASVFAQDKKIIIGYTARDLNNFPLFAAHAKGFFTETGKSVELVQIRSNIGLAGLLGGAFDYYTAFSSAIQWAAQGSPVVGLMTMVDRPSMYLVSRPEIRTVADLKGKTIGLGAIAGINAVITQRILAQYGLGPGDYTMVVTGDLPLRMAAVKSGAVQATTAAPPGPVQAKEMGLNVLAYAGDVVDFPLAGLSTATAKVKSSRAEVVSVITAVLRGVLFVRSQRAEAVAVMQKIFKMDRNLAEAAYDLQIKAYSKDGSASNKSIESVIEVARQNGVTRPLAPADVVDFAPLREAQAALKLR